MRPMLPDFESFVAPARRRPALWRLLAGCLVIAVIYMGAAVLAGMAAARFLPDDTTVLTDILAADRPGPTLWLLATFVPAVPAVIVAALLLHRRGPGSLVGPWGAFARDAVRGLAVTLAIFLPILALWEGLFDSLANLPLLTWLALLPVTVLALGVQTLAEELIFRGYLLQQLAARFASVWVWAVLPSAVFGMLHYDPTTMGGAAPYMVASAGIFGLIAADVTARRGTLGTAWGMHLANNLVAISVLATQGTITGLALRVTPYEVDRIAISPLMIVIDLAPLVLAWTILRRRPR